MHQYEKQWYIWNHYPIPSQMTTTLVVEKQGCKYWRSRPFLFQKPPLGSIFLILSSVMQEIFWILSFLPITTQNTKLLIKHLRGGVKPTGWFNMRCCKQAFAVGAQFFLNMLPSSVNSRCWKYCEILPSFKDTFTTLPLHHSSLAYQWCDVMTILMVYWIWEWLPCVTLHKGPGTIT